MKFEYVVGIDEAGEKAWEAFARSCLIFLELHDLEIKESLLDYNFGNTLVVKRNIDNLNSSCKEEVRWLNYYHYEI